MKQGHFALLFCSLFLVCFFTLTVEQNRYDKIIKEKQRVENCLIKAIEYTAQKCEAVLYESTERKQQEIERAFFDSFSVYLGIFEDKKEQERLKMHIPLVILAEKDGIFIFHMKEVQKEDVVELQHVWMEKIYFSFSEGMTEGEKKTEVARVLEDSASRIITEHNYIAEQYGLKYTFSVPRFLQNTSEKLKFPMLFIVFQGWPLTEDGIMVYENCVDAGIYLKESEHFVVELPENLNNTFCYYHKADCTYYSAKEKRYSGLLVTKEEAVRKYGAISCDFCRPP